jgi:hypothetical protein
VGRWKFLVLFGVEELKEVLVMEKLWYSGMEDEELILNEGGGGNSGGKVGHFLK